MRNRVIPQSLLVFLVCILSAGLVHSQAAPPSVAGDYTGVLAGRLHLKLHIQKDAAEALTATMDSTDQDAYGIACAQVEFAGKKFSFTVPEIGGTYKGEVSADGNTITGAWDQGRSQPLIFSRRVQASAASLGPQLAEIDSMASSEYAKRPVGSVTVGVVSGSQLVWTKSYGNADMEKKLAADKNTVYRIGSITKMFTALMLEQLVDDGKVHLSDPVEKYLPEVNTVQGRFQNAPPITLIQLATHTSGLGREPDDMQKYLQGPVADWEKVLISALPHLHYVFEPGTRFSYSNIGYATLGAALGRAAGQPYVEYVTKHIFETLGMAHSAFEPNPDVLAHLSKGYQMAEGKADTETPQREHAGRGYKVPNGAIYTTVGDLAKFCSLVMSDGPQSVLKAASVERYFTQIEVPANAELSYGYGVGFEVMRRAHYIAVGHGGAVAGYQAALYMNRDKHLGLVVLVNAIGPGTVSAGDLALRSLDLLSK